MRTVIARIDLGFTRVAGWLIYNGSGDNDFDEITPRETMRLVEKGQVNGLKIIDGDLVPDVDNYHQHNIKIRSGVGKYRDMIVTGKQSDKCYSVVRAKQYDDGMVYELATSKCGRIECDESKLKVLMELADVAGVWLNDAGSIDLCNGVEVIDKRTFLEITDANRDEIVDCNGRLIRISELDALTPEVLFGTGQLECPDIVDSAVDLDTPINTKPKVFEVAQQVVKNSHSNNKSFTKKKH